jgi:flagellar motor switch protein FliN/FliY
MTEDNIEDDWGDALQEQADSTEGVTDESAAEEDPWGDALAEQSEVDSTNVGDIDAMAFEELQKSRGDETGKVDLDVLLDIPVTLQLEIGRAKVSIRNLLSYTQGSVVEMDRLAGEPLDLLVNGTLIAHGEVVVINDKFGVRLTDVVSPQERIKKLK